MISVQSPRGGWSSVTPAPDYQGVTSTYGAQLANLKQSEKDNELREKILAYNDGNLSYESLKSYINGRIKETSAGTSRYIDLKETLSELEEAENKKAKNSKRAELEAQFAGDGITADEKLQIEEQLLLLEKEGTPEYTQQLSVIAQARETAGKERIDNDLAKLTAELSQGGITRAEEAKIYEEMTRLLTPGTLEHSQALAKLEETKALQAEEEEVNRLTERRTQLVDAYKEGGITDEEQLDIILQLKGMVDPNSEAYAELIDEEAKVRGNIEAERVAGGKSAKADAEKKLMNEAERVIKAEDLRMTQLENDFESGLISADEYVNGIKSGQDTINDAIQNLLAAGVDVEGEALAENEFNTDFAQKQAVAFSNGELVGVRTKNGSWTLATLDQLAEDNAENFTTKEDVVLEDGTVEETTTIEMKSALSPDGIAKFVISPSKTFYPVGTDAQGNLVVDTNREYPLIPQDENQTKAFNVIGIGERDKQTFIDKMRSDPQFRKAVEVNPEPQQIPLAEGARKAVEAGKLLSPIPTSPVDRYGETVKEKPSELLTLGGRLSPAANIRETVKTVKTLPSVAKQTFTSTFKNLSTPNIAGFKLPSLDFGGIKKGVEEQVKKAASFSFPSFKPLKQPTFSNVFSSAKSTASSVFSKAKSFLGGLFR